MEVQDSVDRTWRLFGHMNEEELVRSGSSLSNWLHHGVSYYIGAYLREVGWQAGEGTDEFACRLQ